ncbi:RNA-binding protein, putative [Bodo saltans]|uniref:RNA-binding protein, putative n=1 Tax=Bodo saltans TaxID=75058 RepID=A0A0S4KEK3_BODSA|nr:RNA-binding protein, putative [Bodo saltans]|eukprot:CUI14130.1 RNA-binding protein, putative [Bodo saltans]
MEAGHHADDKQFLLWNAGQFLGDSMKQHDRNMLRMVPMIANLQEILENTRVAYNAMIADRDAKRQLLVAAEGRLAEVQRVVQRYIIVHEPVVASDGYTYERSVIQQYLEECEENNASAYSQQTKEVLKETLIPNQSLKKLVDLLKTVRPQDIPQVTPRSVIPPFRAGNSVNWGEEEDDSEKPIHASELEAGFSQKKEDKKAEAPPRAESAKEALLRNTGSANTNSNSSARVSGGSNNANNAGSSSSNANNGNNKLHPCLRVYGFCNFKDDCTFARYPYVCTASATSRTTAPSPATRTMLASTTSKANAVLDRIARSCTSTLTTRSS